MSDVDTLIATIEELGERLRHLELLENTACVDCDATALNSEVLTFDSISGTYKPAPVPTFGASVLVGDVSGPASYTTGGFVLDLSGSLATLTFVGLTLAVAGVTVPLTVEVTRNSPSGGKATIRLLRVRYDKLTSVDNVSGQPAGVTVQAASGATTASEATHTHDVTHDHPAVTSGGPSAISGSVVGVVQVASNAHTHDVDVPSITVTSAAGSSHAHVDDNLYQHQHTNTQTQTDAVLVEVGAGVNLSTITWRYLAIGS